MDLLRDDANGLSTILLFPFSDRVSLEPKVESNSRFSCLSIPRIGIQGVFSVMQLGICSKKHLHKPFAGFFFLALKVTGCLHIPREEMEAERAEIKQANTLQGRGRGPHLTFYPTALVFIIQYTNQFCQC